jgi:hypothetical protein
VTHAKRLFLIAALMTGGVGACDAADRASPPTAATRPGAQAMSNQIRVTIGARTFTATLADNAATARFRQMLPLTLDMPDLHNNEKHASLPASLPTETFKPGTIRSGDLLLWGDDTLVLFYDTFRSSYSYTRIGKLDDPQGLAEAVGSGSVKVTFAAK